jgi:3-oxoacyl-[acyl-carrier protein] reductase
MATAMKELDPGPTPRIALVTGGARGLGEAMGRSLHDDGCIVILADLQREAAENTARQLDPTGNTAWAVGVDVRSRSQIDAAIRSIIDRHGRLDVLINNAGVTPVREFTAITPEEWEDVLAINLRSAFFACQLAIPHMRAQRWGRILNITSLAGQLGSRLAGAHYSVSKAGLIVLTKVLAKELAPHGITVNAIAPAVVRAPVMADLPEEALRTLIDSVPVGRMGEAGEVGSLAAFLASSRAGYITGATLDINGGQFMR